MSLALAPLPYTADELSIPNNNPGNAPDYTDHEVISLRRYNGEPLNHTQADDNLELLRRRLGQIAAAVVTNGENISTISDYFYSNEFGDYINTVVNNQTFTDEWLYNLVQKLINDTTLNEHFVSQDWFGDNIQVYVDESVNTYFQDIKNDFFVRVQEFVTNLFGPTNISVDLLENIKQIFGDQYVSINDWTTLNATVENIYPYIDNAMTTTYAPVINQIHTMEAAMNTMSGYITAATEGDGTFAEVDLTAIIERINLLGGDIVTNSDNILVLNNALNVAVANIAVNKANIEILDANFKALELSHRKLIEHVNEAMTALDNLIRGLFEDLKDVLVQIIQQVSQNQLDIATIYDLIDMLARQFFNAIMALWNEIENIWTQLDDHEDRICQLEAQTDSVLSFVDNFSYRSIDICDAGVTCTVNMVQWGSDCAPDMPDIFDTDFEQAMNAAIFACDPVKFKQFKEDAKEEKEKEKKEKKDRLAEVRAAIAAAKLAKKAQMVENINKWAGKKPVNPQAFPVHLPGAPLNF